MHMSIAVDPRRSDADRVGQPRQGSGHGPQERAVTLGDGRRMIVRATHGEGTPLVLLHGLLDSGLGWAWLAAHSERPFVAFDLPGFGLSDKPLGPRLDAYAGDVLATLDVLGVRRCVLVGHSFGGGIAAELADRDPARVASLVLLAPAGFGRVRLAEAVSLPGVRTLATRGLPPALAKPLLLTTSYFATESSDREADRLERVTRGAFSVVPGAQDATRAVVESGRSATALHRRRLRYAGPAHVLWGDRDRVVPSSHAVGVLFGLPQAVVEVWEGMGHNPQRERPQELARFVERAANGGVASQLPSAA